GNFGDFSAGNITTRPNNKILIDLGNFMGQGNLRIQFKFIGARDGDVWAIDNMDIPDGPKNVSTVWTDNTNPNNPNEIGRSDTQKWTPQKIGLNTFEVQRFLIYNSAGAACPSETPPVKVEVFVFDKYTTEPIANSEPCTNNNVFIDAKLKGEKQGVITGFPTQDNYFGKWEVTGPEGYVMNETHFQPNISSPQATFAPLDSGGQPMIGNFTLKWTMTFQPPANST